MYVAPVEVNVVSCLYGVDDHFKEGLLGRGFQFSSILILQILRTSTNIYRIENDENLGSLDDSCLSNCFHRVEVKTSMFESLNLF
jgi:hypothetical protein